MTTTAPAAEPVIALKDSRLVLQSTTRDLLIATMATLARPPDPSALVLAAHHPEDVPPRFTHALLMRDGTVVAPGPIGR